MKRELKFFHSVTKSRVEGQSDFSEPKVTLLKTKQSISSGFAITRIKKTQPIKGLSFFGGFLSLGFFVPTLY